MPRITKPENANRIWSKRPSQMLLFSPGTCPLPADVAEEYKKNWLCAEKDNVLGAGFSLDDVAEIRSEYHRRNGR